MPDAIVVLKADHKELERLFRKFEKATEPAERRSLVDRMIAALAAHAAIEEQHFYPAVRAALPDAEGDVLEGLEEHHIVKWTLSELDGLDPEAERFVPKVTVLMESVRHHVEEEEQELFPTVRKGIGRKELTALGDVLEAAKRTAPRHPEPRASDTPGR